MRIRPATLDDHPALWALLEPVIRAGEEFAAPRRTTKDLDLLVDPSEANARRLGKAHRSESPF